MRRKTIVLFSSLSLLLTQAPIYAGATYSESQVTYSESSTFVNEEKYKQSLQNINSVIEANLEISSDGVRIIEKSNIMRDLNQQDINIINDYTKELGIQLDKPITKASLLKDLESRFNYLNEDIENGKLMVLDNGVMIDPADANSLTRAGATYDETHWWGKRRYMSYDAARDWSAQLRNAQTLTGSLAIASVIFGPAGAFPATVNGATALYCGQIANRVDHHNGPRGIRADMHWILTFDIEPQ